MTINDELIAYLEDLSYLTLGGDEKHRLSEDLEKILSSMEMLKQVDTSSIPERSHPFDNVNAFREDVAVSGWEREMILQNAPVRNEEMFIAPKTVE